MGTQGFIIPEGSQVVVASDGESIDPQLTPKTDIWSLEILMLRLFVGEDGPGSLRVNHLVGFVILSYGKLHINFTRKLLQVKWVRTHKLLQVKFFQCIAKRANTYKWLLQVEHKKGQMNTSWNQKKWKKHSNIIFQICKNTKHGIQHKISTSSLFHYVHQLSWVRISLLLSCITRLWTPPVAAADHDFSTVVRRTSLLYWVTSAATIYHLGGAQPWLRLTSEVRSTDRRQALPLHHHLRWAWSTFFLDRTASSLRESIHSES